MKNGKAISYYMPLLSKQTLATKLNPINYFNYWQVIPILKFVKRKKYKKSAFKLLESGLIQSTIYQIPVRYQISKKQISFSISPDSGMSYLTYLEGEMSELPKEQIAGVIDGIATIEAIIRTKKFLIY